MGVTKHTIKRSGRPRTPLTNSLTHVPVDRGRDGPLCLVITYYYVRENNTKDDATRDIRADARKDVERVSADLSTGSSAGPTVRQFAEQLDFLAQRMEPIDWPHFFAWMAGRQSVPRRCFLLTFDDGLVDPMRTALPVLEQRGLRGVFFVPGAVLTSRQLLPTHALNALFGVAKVDVLEHEVLAYVKEHDTTATNWEILLEQAAPGKPYRDEALLRHVSTTEEWLRCVRLRFLLTAMLPDHLRHGAVRTLFSRHIGSPEQCADRWYLSWEDLVSLEAKGHTIGAHGFGHLPYTQLTGSRCSNDLYEAAAVLRSGLGPDIRPLSYPCGEFDDETCEACRRAGFAQGFTCECGWVERESDPFRLPRVDRLRVPEVLALDPAWAP